MEATSRWYTVTKSHQSSPGPKRFTIQRTGSCELICQFIRQRNSHWATRALLIYIYIFFFLSNPLISLSLSLYMRFFLSGGHVYLLDPVPWLYRRRYLFERRRRQPSGTSNEHFWVVWRERRARYRSWGSQLDEIRTITSFLPSLKEPWNWKGSLSRCHREEGGCPFSPTIGEIKGARAVYVMSLGSWIRIRSARVQLFFTLGRNFVNHLLIEIIDLRTKGRIRLFYCSFRFK